MHIDKIEALIEEVNDKGIQLSNILTQIREQGGDSQCITIAAQDLEAALTWMVRGIKKISPQ